jgi:hypothetical protein
MGPEIASGLRFLLGCVLFVVCWPLAVWALVLYPFVWILLPFRNVAAVLLPARLLIAPFRL